MLKVKYLRLLVKYYNWREKMADYGTKNEKKIMCVINTLFILLVLDVSFLIAGFIF